MCRVAVCDETQNLNETESETFFRYQFFSIPNPILFSIPKKSKPIPILLSIPKFFETDTDTIKKHRKVSKPIPILFSILKNFETDTSTFIDTKKFRNRYHQKTQKSFGTESEAFQIKICGLDNVIVIMTRLIAFQPCSTLGVQNRQKEDKN